MSQQLDAARGVMLAALETIRAGRAVVIDDAFGAGTARGIAHAAAQLLSSGRLRADSVHLDGDFSGAPRRSLRCGTRCG